jgi:transcriptional regulator
MTQSATIDDIADKLDTLIRVQAALAVSACDTQKEKILFLNGAGLSPKEIAAILDTNSNTVSATIGREKKSKDK